ncbi:MAG: efflux RND transporter periplasmic adaptor subunit [Thermoguttaceae bacterium]
MWNLSRIKLGAVREPRIPWSMGGAGVLGLVVLAILVSGCSENKPEMNRAASTDPTVRIVKPQRRNINYSVEQPGFVQAYEQTSIFSKVSGFIKQFNVDIGQEVKKGDLLAEIFVPELDEDHQRKIAQVELDKSQVDQAQQLVKVAESNVQTAIAQLNEAKANVGKSEAEVIRWESEAKRLAQMVQEKVVDKDILTETQRQLDSSKAARDAALAAVAAREADRVTSEANLGKAKIDVETQKAKVKVSEADERKAAAMLAYTQITSPYDGVVTVRNANTGDYVQAVTGDKSSQNPSAIFVVTRTDILRIFLDVPEAYARYVQKGTEAVVRAEALSGLQIPAKVTRTSWAIREKTRTLWTEIDLSAKEYDGLRPGMYVYTKVLVQRPDVFALPQKALTVLGNQTYCFLLQNNKAVKTPTEVGISDGTWVEVDKMKIGDPWIKVTGDEDVIVGDLSELTDGQTVKVAQTNTR